MGQAPASEAAKWAKLIQLARENELKKADREATSDQDSANRKELANKLFDVLRDTAASGRSDGALSVVVRPREVSLLFAAYVADGAKLESVFKTVATWLSMILPGPITLNLDANKYESVNFHNLSIPAPIGDGHDRFAQLFGDSLDVVVGFGKEAIYVGAGKDATKAVEEAIRKSATPVVPSAPFEISIALKPLADLIAGMGGEHEKGPAAMAAKVLDSANGKDRIRLVGRSIERGLTVRFEVEEGILKLIGAVNPGAREFFLGK